MKRPKIVGLTGGIATGKSTVSSLLGELGAFVVDADIAARRVVEVGSEGLQEIVHAFGADVVQPDGTLNRPQLGRIIFADSKARQRLEAITHPRIVSYMQAELDAAVRAKRAPVVILDVPLLFETGLFADDIEESVLVFTTAAIQLQRLLARDGLSFEEANRRIAAQIPIDEKVRLAQRVIDNSGSPEQTKKQVVALWKEWVCQ